MKESERKKGRNQTQPSAILPAITERKGEKKEKNAGHQTFEEGSPFFGGRKQTPSSHKKKGKPLPFSLA